MGNKLKIAVAFAAVLVGMVTYKVVFDAREKANPKKKDDRDSN